MNKERAQLNIKKVIFDNSNIFQTKNASSATDLFEDEYLDDLAPRVFICKNIWIVREKINYPVIFTCCFKFKFGSIVIWIKKCANGWFFNDHDDNLNVKLGSNKTQEVVIA